MPSIPDQATQNTSELAYFWDLETDALSWYGDITLLFSKGISLKTGFSFQKAIDPKDWRKRFQNISLIKEYGVFVQTDFILHLTSDYSVQIQEDLIPHVVNEEGEVKQVLARIVLNSKHAPKRVLQSNSQQLELGLNAIKRRLKFGYGPCGYILLYLKANPWFIYEKEVFELAQACLRATDLTFQSDDDYWVFLQENAPLKLTLETYSFIDYTLKTLIKLCPGGFFYDLSYGVLEFDELDHQHILSLVNSRAREIAACPLYKSLIQIEKVQPEKIPAIARVSSILYNKELTLSFQPIVSSQTLKPKYYECLCRQITAEKTIQGAGSFVPIAEEYGLIDYLDEQLLQYGLKELSTYDDLSLSINVSTITASLERWEKILVASIENNVSLKKRLVVEITETTVFQNLEGSIKFINMLKSKGCLVAIDDFGAGYMSFAHLKDGMADIIKIDGRYVKDLIENPQSQSFIKAIMELAQQCDLLTVAECVETQEQLDLLKHEGVHSFQGYFTGKPTLVRPWLLSESRPSFSLNPYKKTPIALEALCQNLKATAPLG